MRNYDKEFKLDCIKYCAEHPDLSPGVTGAAFELPLSGVACNSVQAWGETSPLL